MAADRKFSHPIPPGVVGLIILVTQGLAFGARLALAKWGGVETPAWLAAGVGAAGTVLLIALITRKLSETS